MLTLHELKEKLDEGLFFESSVGETNDRWYPILHLEILKDYFFFEGEVTDRCSVIVTSYKSGIWIAGRPPGPVEMQICSHVLTQLEETEFSAVYFPGSLLDLPLSDLLDKVKIKQHEVTRFNQRTTITKP